MFSNIFRVTYLCTISRVAIYSFNLSHNVSMRNFITIDMNTKTTFNTITRRTNHNIIVSIFHDHYASSNVIEFKVSTIFRVQHEVFLFKVNSFTRLYMNSFKIEQFFNRSVHYGIYNLIVQLNNLITIYTRSISYIHRYFKSISLRSTFHIRVLKS